MNRIAYSTSTAQATMARTGRAGMLAVAAATFKPTAAQVEVPPYFCSERLCWNCVTAMLGDSDDCTDEGGCKHALFDGVPLGDHPEGIGWPCASLSDDEFSEFYVPWKPCPGCGTTLAGTWGTVTYS